MEPIILRNVVHIPFDLAGQRCRVEATVECSMNLLTGDAIEMTSIDSIIVEEDGQSLATSTLNIAEFLSLVRAIQGKQTL